jgi:glutamate N-acetyltransferase/amino-acid N-acetyltransferase
MCALTAQALGCATTDVLVCQTGLIGIPMPMDPIESGVPELGAQLTADAAGGAAAATALMTTDTVPKTTQHTVTFADGTTATIGGMAKGAAMLAPSMATMLAVLATDVAVAPSVLTRALQTAVGNSFNALVVDACQSTNDTVLVLANGASGSGARPGELTPFVDALTAVCGSLAEQMARDAEGATKLARVTVRGAASGDDARRAARTVAASQLVQCSLNGEDPYWGRVLSELGVSGAIFDAEQVAISYNGVLACRDGITADADPATLTTAMKSPVIHIECDLHAGDVESTMLFTDLSHAYIDENRGTS